MKIEPQPSRRMFALSPLSTLLRRAFTGWGRSIERLMPAAPNVRSLQRRGFMLEPLEPRMLLSADLSYAPFDVSETSADLTLVAVDSNTLELRLTSDATVVDTADIGADGLVVCGGRPRGDPVPSSNGRGHRKEIATRR